MAKLTKNRKESLTKFETEKLYSLKEASDVVKNFSKLKFDSSIDLAGDFNAFRTPSGDQLNL